ncbi:YheC/YheD family protein [Metabacillus litoralis]|uniref:YheC/YheD family protein n=1 Tax=Metabacillus litoralis TaxID=152268 RepID=UPI00203F7007|nr:YheC/YheD family protein [Metabacillus litoralis]MCM3655473.1 YheC/YheD family protein [Metabacillus litoralis]
MQTIVFIGCYKSGTSREALRIANEMGYFTVLFTDRTKYLEQREEFYDVHQMIYKADLLNKESLLQHIQELMIQGKQVKACLSLIDPFVSMAATLSEELGLVSLSKDALYKMENKTRFRKELNELPCTPFFTIFEQGNSIEQFTKRIKEYLPLVLKLPESNGSKDVLLAKNSSELTKGLTYLNKRNGKFPILIEEYIEGPQYLVEVLAYKSKVTIVAVLEQEIIPKKRFIVTGYHFPAQLSSNYYTDLEDVVFNIVSKLGLTNGSCHLELRLSKGIWKLIEINPRISGGAMNQIILHGTGINLIRETIKLNLGLEPSLEKIISQYVYTHYVTVEKSGILQKVTGKNRAKGHSGVQEVFIKPKKGSILTPPLSMGDRYAYILATSTTQENAKEIAINAAKEIQFVLRPFFKGESKPVIGMLYSRKDPSIVKKAFAYATVAKMENIDFYYFTYGSVDVEKGKIYGWVHEKGNWILEQRDFPDVIINNSSPKNRNQSYIKKKLKEKCIFTSSPVGTKMKVYKKIVSGKIFSDFVLPSRILKNSNEVLSFFKTNKRLVIKPISGSRGRGIVFVEKLPNDRFRVMNGRDVITLSMEDFISYIEVLIASSSYLVQRYIECKTKAGLPYDFRLHVQKNRLGEWENTLIYPRISGNNKLVSNVSSGGYRGELIPFLKEEFGNQYVNMQRYLEYFSLSFTKHFESLYENDFDELGIDIGIDENDKLWIYEVNWRPGSKHREFEVAKKLIPYAVFLANNDK